MPRLSLNSYIPLALLILGLLFLSLIHHSAMEKIAIVQDTTITAHEFAYTIVRDVTLHSGLLLVLLSGMAGVLLHWRVTRQARRMARMLIAVSEGQLDARVNVRGGDELALLGRALDEMLQKRSQDEFQLRLRSEALTWAANPILIVKTTGDIVWSNPAFTRLSGYEAEEVLGRNPRFLKSGKHSRLFYEKLWDTVLNGDVWQEELTNKRKDGTLYPEEMTITPLKNTAGEVSHLVAIKVDISRRKTLEKEALLRSEQLVQSEKMASLGVLVSGVAHEINNPNHVITLSVPLVAEVWQGVRPILDRYYEANGDFEVAGLEYSEICNELPGRFADILSAADRIKTIVGELKRFAKDEPSEIAEVIQINHVVKSATTLVANMLKNSTDNFSIEYGENVPKIRGNYQRLEQVLINLLQNACQALPTTKQGIYLLTYQDSDTGMVVVEVIDEGIGIPSESMSRIMEPFFTTKRESGGTGLGLSISSSIMEEHSGNLFFRSAPGGGTIVRMEIPFKSR